MTRYRVVRDPTWGYRRLDPIPAVDDLARFYESRYCDAIRKGGRAPDIGRLLAGGEEAERERTWLAATLYVDIVAAVDEHLAGVGQRRALDIGCGTGDFLAFLRKSGWEVVGTEHSPEIAKAAERQGLEVYANGFEEYLSRWRGSAAQPFTLVSLLNVLEHVPDPVELIRLVRTVLSPDGLLVIRVPNEFNELQLSAQRSLKKEPWWIAVPDHVSYFDFPSLRDLLHRLGWEVLCAQSDFPMEIFLLMGEDYIGNPDVGRRCHEQRRRFELSVLAETRRRWYRALAEAGVGRNCLLIARQASR